jgi:hypothetical protein
LPGAQQVVEQTTVGMRHAFRVGFPQEPKAIFQLLVHIAW